MSERKALYYGQVELIPGIVCDGYILDGNTSVLSERGTADLLDMDHAALMRVVTKHASKTLNMFLDNELNVVANLVEVSAHNSPHKGRKIVVYTAETIENLISAYALALAHHTLRQNQCHIGDRCVILLKALVRTALDTAIKQACGFSPNIQETAQKHYRDAGDIATKKDIATFLKVPESTLSNCLRKYHTEIKPVRLDHATILALGSRAHRMYGDKMEDVCQDCGRHGHRDQHCSKVFYREAVWE